jgi:multiple sugar transport system substrate-binding protein
MKLKQLAVAAAILGGTLVAAAPAFAQEKLTVWWGKGFYKAEDDALYAAIKKFEAKYPKYKVELSLYAPQEMVPKSVAALDAGNPPDVAYGDVYDFQVTAKWAHEGKLEDVTAIIEPLRAKFEPQALSTTFLYNDVAKTRAYYAYPIKQQTMHIQYWKDMLAEAGFKESDIPKDWKGYWEFWCDKVQPAYRQKTGNRGFSTGFPMGVDSSDSFYSFLTFMDAYNVKLVSDSGKLLVDDPAVRDGLIKAMTDYTYVYGKSCTPPSSTAWKDPDNNVAFHNKTIILTHNATISIAAKWLDDMNNPALTEAQRATAKKNYTELIATAGFPNKPDGLHAGRCQPDALCRRLAGPLVPGDQGRPAERLLEERPAPPGGVQPVHERHHAFRIHQELQVHRVEQRERLGQGDEPRAQRKGAGGQGGGRDDCAHQGGGQLILRHGACRSRQAEGAP